MKTPTNPMGPVLTVGMVSEVDRQEILTLLVGAKDIELVIDGKHYPIRTVARYQFAAPDYKRPYSKG